MFYIYNDHQVSSALLHHLSSVRYWSSGRRRCSDISIEMSALVKRVSVAMTTICSHCITCIIYSILADSSDWAVRYNKDRVFFADDVPPYFKTEPARSQLNLERNKVVLTCMAEGSWPLEFKWIHNNTELTRFSLEYRSEGSTSGLHSIEYQMPPQKISATFFKKCIYRLKTCDQNVACVWPKLSLIISVTNSSLLWRWNSGHEHVTCMSYTCGRGLLTVVLFYYNSMLKHHLVLCFLLFDVSRRHSLSSCDVHHSH